VVVSVEELRGQQVWREAFVLSTDATSAAPWSLPSTHGALVGRGIDASARVARSYPAEARQPGVDPERASYGSFLLQRSRRQSVAGLGGHDAAPRPGVRGWHGVRVHGGSGGCASACRDRHGEHEELAGHRFKAELAERVRGEEWPAWFVSYMVAEQAGTDLPT
jgi:hypothetical protein